MYREADEHINQGLSLGARVLLGSVAMLFGVGMVLIAPPTDKAPFFYIFGGFCILIAVACFTAGRVRQFIGSIIGAAIFLVGIWYLIAEILASHFLSGSRAEPSVINAVFYLLFIGIPGAVYAFKVRFGFRKAP